MSEHQDKISMIRRLREETGMGLVEAKKALEDANLDYTKAYELLMARGGSRIRPNREVLAGRIETYNHGGRIGVVIEINCESDFVARTDNFITLCHELAMQVAATNPTDTTTLLGCDYIRDNSKTVGELIHATSVATGENIKVNRFARFELNDPDGELSPLVTPKPLVPEMAHPELEMALTE
jgi:elongation factor Ts